MLKKRDLIDPFNRGVSYLRISVTDRCDFRCTYCMAEKMKFLPKKDVLSLEELDQITSAFTLDDIEDLLDTFFTDFLHNTNSSCSEEDLGVTKTELLLVKLDGIHDGSSSSLVVLGLGHSLGSHNVVASLELGVQHLVWETRPADGDTGQHAVTLKHVLDI